MSDGEILTAAQETIAAFRQAAAAKGENLPGSVLLTIALHMLLTKDMTGDAFYREHLAYEIDRYMSSGLRDSYKKPLF